MSLQQMSILLLEHDRTQRKLIQHQLTAVTAKPDLEFVGNREDYLSALRRQRYDCIVMDYHLPGGEVPELISRYRRYRGHTPVLVLSKSKGQKEVIESLRHGATDFIPQEEMYKEQILAERINQAVLKYRRRRRLHYSRERRRRELARLAETDPLTGLYNRRYFERMINAKSFIRDRRRMMSCFMLDIDYFKEINDRYGHGAGDKVLKDLSEMINRQLHGGDLAFRWGGEEFLILRCSNHLWDAWDWAERLRQNIATMTFSFNGDPVQITVSLGITSFPTEMMSDVIVEMADHALYLAKNQGRNKVCSSDMAYLEGVLQKVDQNEPTTAYQGWKRLMSHARHFLGPNQRKHVIRHCVEVARMATQIAQSMELSDEQVESIRLAALLHDVGKCLIPDDLLAQMDRLTTVQKRFLKHHAQFSVDISRRLNAPPEVIDAIRYHHHAYYDPDRDVDIPEAARLISVADAISAMTMNRAYNKVRTIGEAFEELKRESGKQFDPEVVKALHDTDIYAGGVR